MRRRQYRWNVVNLSRKRTTTAEPSGRAQPKGTTPGASKRYTPPVPKEVKRSPKWFPWMLLGLIFLGVLLIIGNYTSVLPATPSNWYTLAALISILAGALAATYYR